MAQALATSPDDQAFMQLEDTLAAQANRKSSQQPPFQPPLLFPE